jgi:amino acid transporter
MTLWVVGGAVSWCGAVCYAELATAYPRDGGDYEYLSRAFGRWSGFLFAWAQLTVIISGNIGAMAYVFADYGAAIWPAWKGFAVWIAVVPIIVLTLVNLLGIVAGKWVQNLLSMLKVAGLAAIALTGLWATDGAESSATVTAGNGGGDLGLAMVFVLYAYGGWVHAAYVASEVRDPHRNLPRALVLGIVGITLIYLAVNASYLAVLGFDRLGASSTPAADVLTNTVGWWGGRAVSLLVMLSALGAINGMILTGARVYSVWGEDFRAVKWLAKRDSGGGPFLAITVQSVIAVLLVLLVGTQTGRDEFNNMLTTLGGSPLSWGEGFETLVTGTAPVYWGLSLLGGLSVIVLRLVGRGRERPYRVPLYPLPVIVLCAACAYMLYSSSMFARWLALIGVVPMVVGMAVWLVVTLRARRTR